MNRYLVTRSVCIDAKSHKDAARKVRLAHRRELGGNAMNSFQVISPNGLVKVGIRLEGPLGREKAIVEWRENI